ncbi:MAG TPA: bifunctional tetrahydrofolate synthase/dihydrofolate synthase [Gammaproteobacteria bacterium]|nr:bifunctional tetrahydrofolate synthase/dihydrofolate synthase [Gammaproteobacteria bacterium]
MRVYPEIMSLTSNSGKSLRFNTLKEWLQWQEELHFTSIELGLDRCMEVAGNMGLLQPSYKVISVAGTNGKGSSVNMLSTILRHAGFNTGSYTSPHLIRYNERICLNGREVNDDILCNSFNRIDQARGEVSLTYFEFGTLAAFDIFQRAGIDIAILEVGLGGRLDAVNCLDADVALITAIDLDHENWLGPDRETIGREKAGIMRSSSPAVCSDNSPPGSVQEFADELGTRLYVSGKDFSYVTNGSTWDWQCDFRQYADLPCPSLYNPLQMRNAAGVIMVLELLADQFPIPPKAIRSGLREFNLSGRFQIVPDKAQLVLDVAHNQQAAKLLVDNLRSMPVKGNTHVLIGMLKDKNHNAVFAALKEVADFWHLVTLDSPRGADYELLGHELGVLGIVDTITSYDTVANALAAIREQVGPEDRIVITGSFLTVGAAIEALGLQY